MPCNHELVHDKICSSNNNNKGSNGDNNDTNDSNRHNGHHNDHRNDHNNDHNNDHRSDHRNDQNNPPSTHDRYRPLRGSSRCAITSSMETKDAREAPRKHNKNACKHAHTHICKTPETKKRKDGVTTKTRKKQNT